MAICLVSIGNGAACVNEYWVKVGVGRRENAHEFGVILAGYLCKFDAMNSVTF